MKSIAIIFAFLFSLGAFSSVAAQTEKQLKSIRAEVLLINKSAAKYTKSKTNVGALSSEGDDTTFYISGKGLKKVVSTIYGEMGRSSVEYYYSGEELIFAFEKYSKYSGPITQNPKVVYVEEFRAYFSGDKCIRLQRGKANIAPTKDVFSEKVEEIIERSNAFKAGINN